MLLDKFNDIEIKNENRIDESDKLFCETHQQAYDYARENLKDLIVLTTEQIEDQKRILQPINQRLTYFYTVNDSLDKFKKSLHSIHQSFIGNIVEYFANKYKVTLLSEAIKNVLLPKKPDRWRSDADTEAWEEYENALENLSLKYNDILERIFIQLDGFSFFDKAVDELKIKAHSAVWNQYRGKLYEQKKAVITFPDGCWYSPYFGRRTHIELGNGMKNVIKALSYFEIGLVNPIFYQLEKLLDYSFEFQELEFQAEKIKSLKCFKNGRLDIRFTNESYAREFAEDFLGLQM